eukprot:53538-Prymnesium_polylepis.3
MIPPSSLRLGCTQRTLHLSLPSSGAKLPGAHGVGATPPVGLKKPGAADVHSAALVRLVELECLPPGQGAGRTEPSTQNEPAIQSRQPTCPRAGWRLLALHRAHVALPLFGAALPGRHSWQLSALLLPGMGLAFPTGASQAGCVAFAAGGRIVGAGLTRRVRLTHCCGALGGTVSACRACGTGACTHHLAEAAGRARLTGGITAPLVAVLPRLQEMQLSGPAPLRALLYVPGLQTVGGWPASQK